MKTLLIAISTIFLLLFTSCEKEEMDKGLTGGGGGMENSITYSDSMGYQNNDNLEIEYPDSLISKSNEFLGSE